MWQLQSPTVVRIWVGMYARCARVAIAVAAFVIVTATGRRAASFVTPCHQATTTDALDAGVWPLGAASPPLRGDQALLIGELAFDVAARVTGFWSLSVLVGNYYEDGGPYNSNDIIALAEYAARPEQQPAHCLRRAGDDGAAGDATALAACKSFILSEIALALGDGETPDLAATEQVRLHLLFRGDIDVSLQKFGFHLGGATHALQDSFTHAFRSPDKREVRSVLNWVDWLKGGGDYVPSRDGFQHLIALDHCDASDTGGVERREAARQATLDLLSAVAADDGGRAGRLARAGAAVDAWFGMSEVCTADNHWCDAPEQKLTGYGCSVAPASGGATGSARGDAAGVLAVWTLLAAVLAARRARRRPGWTMVAVAVASLQFAATNPAHAANDGRRDDAQAAGSSEVKGSLVKKAGPDEQRELESYPFGIVAGGGISIDNGGFDAMVGMRYDVHRRVTIGVSAEYNPWISYETGKTARGTTQAYFVGIFRLDVRDYLEVRAGLSAGVSVLMFDTLAARSGSVGPFVAVSPLGIAIRMSAHLRLTIDPAEIVVPIPQTTGIPLVYRQHRFSVAVQRNF